VFKKTAMYELIDDHWTKYQKLLELESGLRKLVEGWEDRANTLKKQGLSNHTETTMIDEIKHLLNGGE